MILDFQIKAPTNSSNLISHHKIHYGIINSFQVSKKIFQKNQQCSIALIVDTICSIHPLLFDDFCNLSWNVVFLISYVMNNHCHRYKSRCHIVMSSTCPRLPAHKTVSQKNHGILVTYESIIMLIKLAFGHSIFSMCHVTFIIFNLYIIASLLFSFSHEKL